jgi:predicted nucleic acid-binding protein
MKTVFADTIYWVASLNPRDQWHDAVVLAESALGDFQIITTELVLMEILNFYAEYNQFLRQSAARLVRNMLNDPDIEVIKHSHKTFLDGLKFYETRLDKHYSLTDCVSMNLMRERGINEVLTHDHHFEQEGFTILL